MDIIISLGLFIVAGLFEIGGGYLVWQALKENHSIWYFLTGAIVLILYGIVPTFQEATFSRTYAAYGGIFIVLSILWGWLIDNVQPDRFDLIGGAITLVGVLIIMYYPR